MKKNYKKEKKIKFSIICATVGSDRKLIQLCDSLNNQEYKNFELIVCDQNKNELNQKIKKIYKNTKIKFIKSKIGLSIARNKGILFSQGDYLVFLDDDIILEKKYLKKINQLLKTRKYDVVAYSVINKNNKPLLKYPKKNGYIKKLDQIFNCISSVSFVVKNNNKIYFDKNLGLGSKNVHQSGEETDLLLRLVKKFKYKIFFTKDVKIIHNNKHLPIRNILKKSFFYGCGWSYVVKKNNLNFNFILKNFVKIILNIIYHFLTLNLKKSLSSFSTLIGRIYGFK
tara:strand:+ start:7345 stop:8193 length:849 start_codon:yes stop_codon:yes gene_type:complete